MESTPSIEPKVEPTPTLKKYAIPRVEFIRTQLNKGDDVLWHMKTDKNTYCIYPKTFLFLSVVVCSLYIPYTKCKKEEKQDKLLKNEYQRGYNKGQYAITNNKVDISKLKDLVSCMEKHKLSTDALKNNMELIMYVENQKNIEILEEKNKHYKLTLQNLL